MERQTENPRRKKERKPSIGAYTMDTVDSTPASSSMSERNAEPIGKNDIQVEMAMMMMQRMQREGRKNSHFHSAASLGSSVWSSSGGNSASGSEDSDSFAWSTSLNSESGEESDYSSSYSGSDEYSEDDHDEDEAEDEVPPLARKSYPQPPPGMMEGLPLGTGGLPLSLESLKKDLEKVGRAILSSNAGELAADRAQTLASINWLASHVPNAVLDQLGYETRELLVDGNAEDEKTENSEDSRLASVVESDAMSDVSDLSNEHAQTEEFEQGLRSDATDIANAAQSYGDLATYTQPTGGDVRERPPSTIHSSSSNPEAENSGTPTKKKGIMEILPQAEEHGLPGLPGGIPTLLSPNETSGSRRSKGVKGLFKRFVKRRNGSKVEIFPVESAPPLDGTSPEQKSDGYESSGPLEADGDDDDAAASQSLAGSSQMDEDVSRSASGSVSKEMKQPKVRGKRLPYSSNYRCALLFVDISGFTKLSTKLDPESLSKVIPGFDCGPMQHDKHSPPASTGNQRLLSADCKCSA